MSGSESFLSRWSRRKAESAERREVSPAESAPAAAEAKPDGAEAMSSAPFETSALGVPAFDPASLPSIESVAAGADIRPFLQLGVPVELTRTALRIAWATDPAIRDFIGIAENQWDFNDPTAMPGFGPLRPSDDAATLAAQTLGRASNRTGQIEEVPPATREADALEDGEPVDRHERQTSAHSARSPADDEAAGLAEEQDNGNIAGERDGAIEEREGRRIHRSHGSALPQ